MNIERIEGIRVVAFDIYGTILTTEDHDNALNPRKGLDKIVEECKKGIKIESASDGNTQNVKTDLEESGVDIQIFQEFYQLIQVPKEFSIIIQDQEIEPHQLLVIGDTFEKDIQGAIDSGAQYVQVPEFEGYGSNSDISFIKFR